MAEAVLPDAMSDYCKSAKRALEAFLFSRGEPCRTLTDSEILELPFKGCKFVWETVVRVDGVRRDIYIGTDGVIPFSRPRIAVKDADEYFLKYPHIEKNGTCCLLHPSEPHAPLDDCSLLQYQARAELVGEVKIYIDVFAIKQSNASYNRMIDLMRTNNEVKFNGGKADLNNSELAELFKRGIEGHNNRIDSVQVVEATTSYARVNSPTSALAANMGNSLPNTSTANSALAYTYASAGTTTTTFDPSQVPTVDTDVTSDVPVIINISTATADYAARRAAFAATEMMPVLAGIGAMAATALTFFGGAAAAVNPIGLFVGGLIAGAVVVGAGYQAVTRYQATAARTAATSAGQAVSVDTTMADTTNFDSNIDPTIRFGDNNPQLFNPLITGGGATMMKPLGADSASVGDVMQQMYTTPTADQPVDFRNADVTSLPGDLNADRLDSSSRMSPDVPTLAPGMESSLDADYAGIPGGVIQAARELDGRFKQGAEAGFQY